MSEIPKCHKEVIIIFDGDNANIIHHGRVRRDLNFREKVEKIIDSKDGVHAPCG